MKRTFFLSVVFLMTIIGTSVMGQTSDIVKLSIDSVNMKLKTLSTRSLENVLKVNAPQVVSALPQTSFFEDYIRSHRQQEVNSKGFQEITIPIYAIKIEGLEIPISLSYQTKGIRFNQHNGEVGVGWVLNPGFRVSRTVFGLPDEHGYRVPSNIYEEYSASKQIGRDDMEKNENGDKFLGSFFSYCAPNNTPGSSGKLDSGHDHFFYSTLTSNGHFIVTDLENKKVNILEQSNEKITFSYTNNGRADLTDISIKDDQGFKYSYGKSINGQYMYEQNVGINALVARTAWPLMYVESPYKKKVLFEYISDYVQYQDQIQLSTYTVNDAQLGLTSSIRECAYMRPCSIIQNDPESYSQNQLKSFLISKIISDNEIIKFIRNDNFPSVKNSTRLTRIEVYDKHSGELIKYVKFQYSDVRYPHYFLKLIMIGGRDIKAEQIYKFDYKGDDRKWGDNMRTSLNYFTADQWGYYKEISNTNHTLNYIHEEFKKDLFFERAEDAYNTSILNAGYKMFGDCKTLLEFATRSSNSDGSIFSLTKITYPTGGSIEYEYEPHQFSQKEYNAIETTITGGGVRIKKKYFNDGGTTLKMKRYIYGHNELGIGKTSLNITHKVFADEYLHLNFIGQTCMSPLDITYDVVGSLSRIYSNRPLGDLNIPEHFSVDYPQVSVLEQELSSNNNLIKNNGKTVYEFTMHPQFIPSQITPRLQPMRKKYMSYQDACTKFNRNMPIYIGEYRYGNKSLLKSKIDINSSGDTICFEKFTYKKKIGDKYNGIRLNQRIFTDWNTYDPDTRSDGLHSGSMKINVNANYGSFYDYVIYQIVSGVDLLESKTQTNYTLQGKITSQQQFDYDNKYRLVKTTQINNVNDSLIKKLTYPSEKTELANNNMISVVLETVTTHNNEEIGRIKNNYATNSISLYSTQTSASGVANLRTDIIYDLYDNMGHIRQYTTLNGISTVYLWSYNGQYPIAEIKNATYSTVNNALSIVGLISADALLVNMNPDRIKLEKLRAIPLLSKAMITTYTYKPFRGILTATSPSGIITYYDYDSFGRLKETYIYKDNIESPHKKMNMQSYRYHYRD